MKVEPKENKVKLLKFSKLGFASVIGHKNMQKMKAHVFNGHQCRYENLAIYSSSESITQMSHYNTQ